MKHMINEAMFVRQDELNDFTEEVKKECLKNGKCLVMLRDDSFREVMYTPEKDDGTSEGFHTEKWDFCWRPDGSSLTKDEWDMVEAGMRRGDRKDA